MINARWFKIGFLLMLLLISSSARSGESVDKLLKRLEQTTHAIHDFEADFEQIEFNPILNRQKKSAGRIYSLSEGKIFWHTTKPTVFKVISNGTDIWLYYPHDQQLFHEKWGALDSQTKLALLFLRREEHLDKYFSMKWRNRAKQTIELLPKQALGVEKIWMTVTPKNIFLKKLIFFFPLGRKTELILKNVKLNQNLWKKHQSRPLDQNISQAFTFKTGTMKKTQNQK